MKTVYIPKGETVHYESLTTEHLVVHGRLHVTYGVKAQSITGSGVIDASSINADTVCIDDVESGTVICKRLIAKRVQAPEVFASESAAVSCFLSAAYVETGKLTAAISEVDEVVAQEVVNKRQAEVIRLVFVDGIPTKEVAASFGLTYRTIDRIKRTAIENLAEMYAYSDQFRV